MTSPTPPEQDVDEAPQSLPLLSAPRTRREARASRSHGRAGRNLPAAIASGLGLGVVVLASLFLRKEAFVVVVAAAVCAVVWELSQALSERDLHVPVVPVVVGSVGMLVAGFSAGGQALAVCFVLTAVGVVVWRASEGADGALKDVAAGLFVSAYAPLLAGFAMVMLAADDGARRVLTFVIVTICSDIGGYAAGVLAGRHPMARSVSPKKSWEGFAGSVVACVVAGAATVTLLLDGPWWGGALLGAAVVLAATLGDLGESMLKRDLGIKDMGSLLPGHGGVADRLDSLLVSAPVAWLLLYLIV
jgi:phosphatidate cytidylyltransferase